MRILVTGAGGLIGGALAEHLAAGSHRVTATYRNTPAKISAETAARVTLVRCDLAEGLRGVEPAEVVIHAAAVTHLDKSARAEDYIRANLQGALELARYARSAGTRLLVFLSTFSVYGNVEEPVLREAAPLRAPHLYGATKYVAELVFEELAEQVPAVCVRLPGVVGPGYLTPWVGQVLARARAAEPIRIYNGAAPFNNVVDLVELARFLETLLAREHTGFERVNLAASEPLPVRQVVDVLRSAVGSSSEIVELAAARSSFSVDIARLQQLYGYTPAPTRAILERYAATHQREESTR